ncbi:MAG: DNA-directed RNA polymerase subunit beta, partial [Candidatus Kapabacteria bacterium]|nr:DNA-directed RNA polymerase subunit beta [Candidatus Kapabacteria bacterium]
MNGPQDTSLYTMPLVRLRNRVSFERRQKDVLYPDLLGIQIDSFKEFLQEDVHPTDRTIIGLQRAFINNFPIEDNSGIYELNFLDFFVEKPKYTEEECRERELTYAKTLKARLRLSSKADPSSEDYIEAIEQEVYLGNIPAMTPRGTFIINGAERVVVAQLHRSPGVFFDDAIHPNGTKIFSARIIPFKGSWVEFTTDIHDVMYAYIDRKKKFPVTTLLRALGYSSDEDLLALFDLAEDVAAENLNADYLGRRIAADVIDMNTGEIVAMRDNIISEELLLALRSSGAEVVKLYKYENPNDEPIIAKTLAKDLTRTREDALES